MDIVLRDPKIWDRSIKVNLDRDLVLDGIERPDKGGCEHVSYFKKCLMSRKKGKLA